VTFSGARASVVTADRRGIAGTRASHYRSLPHGGLSFAALTLVGLLVGWRSLGYDWNWDDLHLVRPYSASEIARSLVSNWDPDNIETLGFRPGTVIFNDLRARVFGESTRAHRIFLMLMFSGYLVSLGALAARLGAPWWIGLAAGTATLCAKNSYYHYIWISDGIHLVPALLFVASAHLLLDYLSDGGFRRALISALLMLVALAAREDTMALYPALVLIGATWLSFVRGSRAGVVRLVRYAACLFCTFVPFWVWRLFAVPRAPNFRVNWDVVVGPLRLFDWTICLSGQVGGAWRAFLAAFVVLGVGALGLPRDARRHALMWLALAAIACLPGAVRARPNLLLFPISFYTLFAALTLAGLVRTRRSAVLACVLTLVAATVSVRASRLEQLSLHSLSEDKIFHDWQGLYSAIRFSSIPPERAQRTKASLARFGIVQSAFDFEQWKRDLAGRGRIGFIDDGEVFLPERNFLTP
jgi:hypothetical protein